jgi:pimeloyl-ACP methyl ester carboxylesterase
MPAIGMRLGSGWERHAESDWLARWRPEPVALAGGTTDAVACGAGPTVVLVPPLPGFKEAWIATAARLAAHHRVVTCDRRAALPARDGWRVLLADLEAVLDALAPGRVVLAGHSLGGALALRWALERPERVRGLVLSSSFARLFTPWRDAPKRFLEQPVVIAAQRWLPESWALALARGWARRRAWVYDPRCGDAVLALVRAGIRATPIPLAAARVRLAVDHDARPRLGEVRVPALVVAGERESRFVRRSATELATGIPGARQAQSPGVGHLHPLSSPDWLAETIAEWMGAVPP